MIKHLASGNAHKDTTTWEEFDKVKQIDRTKAEPQQIVATRLLYCLQYPVPIQVVCKRFTPAIHHLSFVVNTFNSFQSNAQNYLI